MNRAPLFILLLAGTSCLGGCFWVVVGGAGAEAGYVATQDDRKAGETVSDQWIFTKVKAELIATSGVSSGRITIKVRRGVVALQGVLSSAEEKSKALAAARGVEGVKKVVDKLFVAQ